jgi:hypothetical protein
MAVDGVGPGSAEFARYDASQALRIDGNSVDYGDPDLDRSRDESGFKHDPLCPNRLPSFPPICRNLAATVSILPRP